MLTITNNAYYTVKDTLSDRVWKQIKFVAIIKSDKPNYEILFRDGQGSVIFFLHELGERYLINESEIIIKV